jgi:hypothetical protein
MDELQLIVRLKAQAKEELRKVEEKLHAIDFVGDMIRGSKGTGSPVPVHPRMFSGLPWKPPARTPSAQSSASWLFWNVPLRYATGILPRQDGLSGALTPPRWREFPCPRSKDPTAKIVIDFVTSIA